MPTPSDPDAEDFLPLHPFELRILVLTEGPAHGYPIIRVIEERDSSWKRVLPANLYRRLRDLRARCLVQAVEAPDGAPDDERQRRTYALTELVIRGRDSLAFERRGIPHGRVAPPRNSAAIPSSSRLALRAPRRSRCSTHFGHGPLGRRVAVAEARRLDALVADAKRVLREV